jgi:16S rRNA (cytidine1402-2'-O)-methyltransferase
MTSDPVVLFEAANRTPQTIAELSLRQPERPLCVARELTKRFESIETRSLSDWNEQQRDFRGEITLVLGACAERAERRAPDDLDARIESELQRGVPARAISLALAKESGLPRRELYQRVLAAKGQIVN